MIQLKPVSFYDVQSYFVDFQKKSGCFELPPEAAEFIGIFDDTEMIGYFITLSYTDKTIEINQGYLRKEYRHFDYSKKCTEALEHIAKQQGFKEIKLGTHNRFRSYLKFAKSLGYKPEHLTFSKNLGEQ